MTPFMHQVQDLLNGQDCAAPHTVPSEEVTVAEAADTQVIIRSLAEQLVSEANAILSGSRECDGVISLVDQTGPGALAFTLGYADRSARIETVVSGHTATAQLVVGGVSQSRRLAGEDEVAALVLDLIAGN
ncbi:MULTISPECIES: hypothetical protein [Gordonia]|uniref:Uncharacterized protein n=1 Tax=Gordonia sihwensis NBRC 108236 TaxID=1223544 RepID=L7LHZ4_9ACTN|nr:MULTISPECIES: hypothetical protein [Gordonia]AUH68093.1 hypothetical protein CXX93_06725 [Gordonia sp. YC-JH1]KJR07751.1 hypothetical protein UG54_09795 [Gordonia sihwensis]MBY4569257.1 hypothetical protein [Gordonia sihwensis]WFN92168.1 hypothetical protein P5P27_15515 [Gordonia sihwensis]GAC60366.1 hypothetical protein GSI01S_09_00280 [Gordonia sihwensis NBRC 108236]